MATISKSTTDLKIIKGKSSIRTETVQGLINENEAIFFETDTHRIYVGDTNGNIKFGSNVDNVEVDDTGKLTIYYIDGTSKSYDLAVDEALTGLKDELTGWVNGTFIATSQIAKESSDINTDKDTAETQVLSGFVGTDLYNRITAANTNANTKVASVNGNLVSYAQNTETNAYDYTKVNVDIYAHYDSTNKKIWLYQGSTKLASPSDTNTICGIDASDFVKDGMLSDTEIVVASEDNQINGKTEGTFIKFTWNTDGGEKEDYLDVTTLIDTYEGSNSIEVKDHTISLKINSNGGLSVSENGVGIQPAFISSHAVASINGKVGIIDIEGGDTSEYKDTDGTVLKHIIDVHPKWYTIS